MHTVPLAIVMIETTRELYEPCTVLVVGRRDFVASIVVSADLVEILLEIDIRQRGSLPERTALLKVAPIHGGAFRSHWEEGLKSADDTPHEKPQIGGENPHLRQGVGGARSCRHATQLRHVVPYTGHALGSGGR